ncbi:MAG TPA: hypothetical protein VF158_05615 [Longimicrobiales bacterium]
MKTMRTTPPGVTAAETDALLTYRFSTDPDPLQVSTVQTATNGRINLAVFAGNEAVYCDQIQIAVPVGPEATDFSTDTPVDSVNTEKWSLASTALVAGTELGIDDASPYATFTFKTRDASDNRIDYNLVFGLSATVNQVPGSFSYIVQERSGTQADPSTYTLKRATFALSKELPTFYLKNFVAAAPSAPTVPATEFANGADIRLSWESNGTYFRIYSKGDPKPIYSGTDTSFTLTGGVATDTTFVLVASVTGDPTRDGGAGYEPIYLYEALTITVSNPDLTPKSTAVAGNASVGGTLDVTGATTLHATTVDGALGVSGTATLGAAQVNGAMGVTGKSTLQATAVQGTLDVTGATSLTAATITGLLTAAGAVGMMGAPRAVSPGSYSAKTDGIVIGYVGFPPNDAGSKSLAWIWGSTAGMSIGATGGNTVYYMKSHDSKLSWSKCSNPASFTMPVKRGATWSVSVQQGDGNEQNPPTAFYWIPIGSDAADTFERIGEPELPEAAVGAAVAEAGSEVDDTHQENIDALMEVLQEAFGPALDADRRARLREAVKRLVFQEIHRAT